MQDKVDILVSIYNPNLKYLEQQLVSLDNQTYENIEIIIFDDCIDKRCDTSVFEKCIKKKKYQLLPYNSENLGYVKAFETLVKASDGAYIAFCDQDDIWDDTKIEKSVDCIKREKTLLVTTDRRIINQDDVVVNPSIRHSSNKKYDTWASLEDIGKYNFFTTCAIGMCILVDGDFVRSIVPFSEYEAHDKWVTACAACRGTVSYLDEVLASYRRHGKNVSGILSGVDSKKDYICSRVEPQLNLIEEYNTRYPGYKGINEALEFAYARKTGNIAKIYKYRYLAPDIAWFDIAIACVPECLVKIGIKLLKKIA